MNPCLPSVVSGENSPFGKADIKSDDECWEWTASKNKKGYGNFYISVGHSKDKHCLAHRRAWILTYGEIPQGLQVLHSCDNPPCVNPKHLFLGTNEDNVKDKIQKGRARNLMGEEHPNSKLTEDKVVKIRLLRSEGLTLQKIGSMYNIDLSTVGKVCNRQLWKQIP